MSSADAEAPARHSVDPPIRRLKRGDSRQTDGGRLGAVPEGVMQFHPEKTLAGLDPIYRPMIHSPAVTRSGAYTVPVKKAAQESGEEVITAWFP